MSMKERHVFSFSNFRGLDREHKPLMVHPSRATNGINFQIDSGVLKTRPAVKFKRAPIFSLDEDDFIIDWYDFRGIYVYVTKKHIYIENAKKQEYFNETTKSSKFIHPEFPTFNFSGFTPVFQEEKEVLFIFGLDGNIFIFSVLSDGKYVLYELRNKPYNPYSVEQEPFYTEYENLPIPYEPTIFIGENRFEDVNLLSKVTKYRLFASTKDFDDGGRILYRLPTHYDPEKHGEYREEVTIYKNKFSDFTVVPVFLGREGEDFEEFDPSATFYNNDTPFEIQNVFTPANDFEYRKDGEDITPISEILGLDKNTFFNFKEKNLNMNVFELLINIIRSKGQEFDENKIVVFKLPVRYKAVYRDANNNYIIESSMKQSDFLIYVLLKKYSGFLENPDVYTSLPMKVTDLSSEDYPEYPAVPETIDEDNIVDLPGSPFKVSFFSRLDFQASAMLYLWQNKEDFTSGQRVRVNARFYEEYEIPHPDNIRINWMSIDDHLEDFVSEEKYVDPFDIDTFPDYPSVPGVYSPVIELSPLIETIDINFHGDTDTTREIEEAIYRYFLSNKDEFPEDSGKALFKIRVFERNPDGRGEDFPRGVSAVIPVNYEKARLEKYQNRYSASCLISFQVEAIEPGMYEFRFNEVDHVFELRIKDYYFDYNNEPSIEVKITFDKNPEYELVSKCRFGITFGSENRLFLAGHPEYPNIDRYNVSNDLLSDMVGNQSYELSYFPSRNRRVVGGPGAINGYVVATDTHLYVTKEDYPNDQKLFVRERILDENGVVGYKEYKTSVGKTPLNHRCIVRFFNDILMLTKDGLYGIEISGNILVNERLIKPRSLLIDKDLSEKIKKYDKHKIYIAENNQLLYIFIGETVFVADVKYVFVDEHDPYEFKTYEMVEWELPFETRYAKFLSDDFFMLDDNGKIFYHFEEDSNDDLALKLFQSVSLFYDFAFLATQETDEFIDKNKIIRFIFSEIYGSFAKEGTDFVIKGGVVYINNPIAFADLNDGDTIYFQSPNGEPVPFVVAGFEASDRWSFSLIGDDAAEYKTDYIYKDFSNKPLYLLAACDYKIDEDYFRVCILEPHYISEFITVEKEEGETYEEYAERLLPITDDATHYFFGNSGMQDFIIIAEKPIQFVWVSCITDFNNNLWEKTMFMANIYATKQAKENNLYLGCRTMRRLKALDEVIPLPNNFDFGELDFNMFAFSTFPEFGMSIRMKENNFLYIQFMVKGEGRIQLNALEIIYKLNRRLKTIG